MNVKTKKLGNGITNVIINDPKTYNSLSFKTLRDLLNTFTRLDKDDNTRVIILEGSGKGFSAGHNLKEVGGIKNRYKRQKLLKERNLLLQKCMVQLMQLDVS